MAYWQARLVALIRHIQENHEFNSLMVSESAPEGVVSFELSEPDAARIAGSARRPRLCCLLHCEISCPMRMIIPITEIYQL